MLTCAVSAVHLHACMCRMITSLTLDLKFGIYSDNTFPLNSFKAIREPTFIADFYSHLVKLNM
jgi:hypothetical protein